MSTPQQVDVGLGILDHQLIDSEGRRCGNVDDLELEGLQEGKPQVRAILVGPPVWRGRGRLGRLAALIARGETVRVPWDRVNRIEAAVHLKEPARDLGLGRGDDRARKWVEWIPGS